MILARLALRNLSRHRRRSFLLGGALAFSVFIIIALNGLAGGVQSSVSRNAADLISGHIFFTEVQKGEKGRLMQTITNDKPLLEQIKTLGLPNKSLTRRTMGFGTLIYGNESIMRGLAGVNWTEETVLPAGLQFVAGSAADMAGSTGIIISTSLAELLGMIPKAKLGAKERDTLKKELRRELKAQSATGDIDNNVLNKRFDAAVKATEEQRQAERQVALEKCVGETIIAQLYTIHGQQNVGEFQVKGVYEARIDFYTYVDRDQLNQLIDMQPGSYNMFGIFLTDTIDLDMKTMLLYQAVRDSYDMYPLEKLMGQTSQNILGLLQREEFDGSKAILTNLNNELGIMGRLDTFAFALSIGLMLLLLPIIMVGIYNTYRIVVYERTKEIGTMRALGTQKKQVRNLFLLEAAFLSLGGLLVGSIVAYLALAGIHLFELSVFTELSFFLDKGHLAYAVQPQVLFTTLFLVCGLTLLAAFLPARRAARLAPAHALRGRF